MLSQYMEEFEQDPFEVGEFIERLTWRTNNELQSSDEFSPLALHDTFIQTIKDLKILQEKHQSKCERLEESLRQEKEAHAKRVAKLQERHQIAIDCFGELDEKINSVAGKIKHLGQQLENVNTPRSRSVEAQKLLSYMSEFLISGPIVNDIFTDAARLNEAADVIQKLYTISQDLPPGNFAESKRKIEKKYDEVERRLIEEFATAQKSEDIERMKALAQILSQFKGYAQCVDAYIEQSQMTPYSGKDIFIGIVPLCKHHYEIIKKVFANPQQVMSKFILNIYQLKLHQYAMTKLEDKKNEEKYLRTLYELYSRTLKLSTDLQIYMSTIDDDLLQKLTQQIFMKHLAGYAEMETKCLTTKCSTELEKFYASKKHQKTQKTTTFRRNMEVLIATRANINIAAIEDYGGETFLSEELAINMLQEAKASFKRCRLLSTEAELPSNAIKLNDILLRFLMHEHVDYALELGLQAVPLAEGKIFPQLYFFDVVQKTNIIVHLLDKLCNTSIIPCVSNTAKYSDYVFKKRILMEQIETKLDQGLDRSISAVIGWVKVYLQYEQKKTDYKPETDVDTISSAACLQVVQNLQPVIVQIKKCVDGENLQNVLTEFGTRLHRVIYDHLQTMQFNTAGAMCAICDVNEYRKCIRDLDSPLVTQLFDILHALCNLLLVKPQNLQEVCTGDTLNYLDKSVVRQFIQLRTDFRFIKNTNYLKGIIE
ncbi:exocyst complex component 5 [Scaptodrosophila lebanonensis]|uniref:Exocyst complex component 5 n=1 Tax=Drosophila lebanonensis TaxID=7225 RepID=A0A6J2T255_DROLE|nr:exocyst complex component 5 [Scaptodrosophila lebanonensis]